MVLGAMDANEAKNTALAKQVETGAFRLLRFMALLHRDAGVALTVLWHYSSDGAIVAFAFFFVFDLVRDESIPNWSRHGLETRDYRLFAKLCYGDLECFHSARRSVEGRPTQL